MSYTFVDSFRAGPSSAHHQEFIHCTFGTGICHQTCMTYTSAECTRTVNKLLMLGRGTARNMWIFLTKINLGN